MATQQFYINCQAHNEPTGHDSKHCKQCHLDAAEKVFVQAIAVFNHHDSRPVPPALAVLYRAQMWINVQRYSRVNQHQFVREEFYSPRSKMPALWETITPNPLLGIQMADGICNALFGTSTVSETARSIMQDAKEMTSMSPAAGSVLIWIAALLLFGAWQSGEMVYARVSVGRETTTPIAHLAIGRLPCVQNRLAEFASPQRVSNWHVCRGQQFTPWILGRLIGGLLLIVCAMLALDCNNWFGRIGGYLLALGFVVLFAPVPWDLGPCPVDHNKEKEYRQTQLVVSRTAAMPTTPQEAVVTLQHIINRFDVEPDVIYTAAVAIADIATEAAENGTIVDPLMGSDFESPAQDSKLNGYDYTHQAWVVAGRYVRCGHLTPCDCYGRTHEGESPAPDAEVY